MSDRLEPIYLVAKNVIQQANQFKNNNLLTSSDNIPPQFVISNKQIDPPPLPYRQVKTSNLSCKSISKHQTFVQINDFREQTKEIIDNLKEFFSLTTDLAFRLVILFIIYISIIYNLYRSLAALYLIETNFRLVYHLSPDYRTIYSLFMLLNLFVDCYGVYTLIKKNVVHIFLYAICITFFSLFILIIFGRLSTISVILSLIIASLCYLFTFREYKKLQPEVTSVCQACIHHINQS